MKYHNYINLSSGGGGRTTRQYIARRPKPAVVSTQPHRQLPTVPQPLSTVSHRRTQPRRQLPAVSHQQPPQLRIPSTSPKSVLNRRRLLSKQLLKKHNQKQATLSSSEATFSSVCHTADTRRI